jgi:zinc transporter 5/7
MFVELFVGLWTNSLGLISDAGHMLFDSGGLFIGLYASYISKWRADPTYTYGYGRYEVLSGFVNAVFLVFIGFFILLEAAQRLAEPPEVHTGHLILTSVAGFGINMVGLFFFHDHAHGGGGCDGHGHSDHNMKGIFLHILADTLGSFGVIVSSVLIQFKGWHISDPICSIFISVLILLAVVPLLQDSAAVLLCRVPYEFESALDAALLSIKAMGGVVAVRDPHFWQHSSEMMVGSITVVLDDDADAASTLAAVSALLKGSGVQSTTVEIQRASKLVAQRIGLEVAWGEVYERAAKSGAGGAGAGPHHGHSHGGNACHGHGH